jgi:hypothetical protein
MTLAGFPHSGTPGSRPTCGSPRIFAACRALLRLSVPRHPPCALVRLTGYPARASLDARANPAHRFPVHALVLSRLSTTTSPNPITRIFKSNQKLEECSTQDVDS